MADNRLLDQPAESFTTPELQHVVIPKRAFRARLEGPAVGLGYGIRHEPPHIQGNSRSVWHNHRGSFGGKNKAQPPLAGEKQ